MFFNAHIQSIIDYASTLWDSASENSLKPLKSLHKRALKIIVLKNTQLSNEKHRQLNILSLKARFSYNKAIMMHKLITKKSPSKLCSKFVSNNKRDHTKIYIPLPRIDLFKTSLIFSGSMLWNSLPNYMRQINSSSRFKNKYFSFLLK